MYIYNLCNNIIYKSQKGNRKCESVFLRFLQWNVWFSSRNLTTASFLSWVDDHTNQGSIWSYNINCTKLQNPPDHSSVFFKLYFCMHDDHATKQSLEDLIAACCISLEYSIEKQCSYKIQLFFRFVLFVLIHIRKNIICTYVAGRYIL